MVKLHLKNDPDWSDARVRGVDPVYSAPTIMEKRRLLHSQETVSVIVARHPFIRHEMKIFVSMMLVALCCCDGTSENCSVRIFATNIENISHFSPQKDLYLRGMKS